MSIWHNSTGEVIIRDLSVNFTVSPELKDSRDCVRYFNSGNDKLNGVWYSGAYTNQLCTVDPAYGNAPGVSGANWYYNATIYSGYPLFQTSNIRI